MINNLLTIFRKFEIRISKSETNPNFECSNDKNRCDPKSWPFLVWLIYISVIEICFEFRVSDFE